ncbi:MAG: ankyrin repeat domain-containing protein [Verrucomicrobia bacterium]|nr:ankyrin repeat domain-containing protein [Verrucomicrobiota bacterium]
MSVRYDNQIIPNLSNAFGYPYNEGLCKGISRKGWEAILCNDMKAFDDRLRKIESIAKKLKMQGRSFQDFKGRDLRSLMNSIDPNLYVDVWAFLDGVHIGQSAVHHQDFFIKEKNSIISSQLHQDYNKETSLLTAPLQLEKQGGAVEITRFTGVYTKPELIQYFSSLRKMFEGSYFESPIAFELGCFEHAIAIGYSPIERKWFFIDANNLSATNVEGDDAIAEKVFSALSAKGDSEVSISTIAYSTKNSLKKLQEKITRWKTTKEFLEIHKVTPHKVKLHMNAMSRNSYLIGDKISWLLVAVSSNDLPTLLNLINAGADVNESNLYGATSLHIAAHTGNVKMMEVLLQNGGNPYKICMKTGRPIHIAAYLGHTEIVKMLLKYPANINSFGGNGATALMLAASSGHLDIIKLLLQAGADVNAISLRGGKTALMAAAQGGHLEIVKVLLKAGADKYIDGEDGESPFSLAYKYGHIDVMKLLSDRPSIRP